MRIDGGTIFLMLVAASLGYLVGSKKNKNGKRLQGLG